MDVNYLYIVQILMVLLLLCAAYRWSVPRLQYHYIYVRTFSNAPGAPCYLQYRKILERRDTESFEKYDIWRYVRKKRAYLLFS